MTLYHFCSKESIRGILTDGLTKGMVPGWGLMGGPRGTKKDTAVITTGWQWMTLDGDHMGQSWATSETIKENRTEFRLTIEIPEKELDSLYDKDRFLTVFPHHGPLFEGWAGSENWRIYRGNVSKYCIKKVEHWNPEFREWEKWRKKN